MSVSLKESYDIAYDGSENAARMDLFIDTSDDLAGLTHFDSIKLLQGSTAEDISTGDKYMMQTGGTWVLQPSSNVFSNVYTKAEIDAIIANYYTSAQTDEYYQWVIVTIDTDVLPLAFLSDGTPLTAWSITGDMTQTGTPTPTVPITPEECGERTGNLFDNDTVYTDFKTSNGFSGTASQISPVVTTCFTSSDIGKTFTASCKISNVQTVTNVRIKANVNESNLSGTMINTSGTSVLTFTVETVNDSISLTYSTNGSGTYDFEGIMLVEGSEPANYEPYGKYKIPITNGNTTYNVYLSEPLRKIGDYGDTVASDGTVVRRIKKLVLTGQETGWEQITDYPNRYFRLNIGASGAALSDTGVSSHFERKSIISTNSDVGFNIRILGLVSYIYIRPVMADITYNTASFKQWLSDEYSADHPVEVWYVLANPVTEQITAPTITPQKGANTLTVGTTLPPSEVSITGGIREGV